MSYEKTAIVTGAEQSVGEGLVADFLKSACDVVGTCLVGTASLYASAELVLMKLIAWRNWYCVLRHRNGFGLLESVRFGLWLARGSEQPGPNSR